MCKNIVIFGPTSSGKSTLMGYLQCHDREKKENQKIFDSIRREIEKEGILYHPDRKLAYLVDTSKEERRDNLSKKNKVSFGQNKRGSTTRIHICKAKVGEEDCTFIETPGSDQYWLEKNEGVFLGDIGIYVIEIKHLLALAHKIEDSSSYKNLQSKIFSALYLWKHYKNITRLVIAITKIDMDYSKFAIESAIRIFQSVSTFSNVRVVPISIDVDRVEDCNIYNVCPKVAEVYKGKTLMQHLRELVENDIININNKKSNFAHIHRVFEINNPNLQTQTAFRIKVLSGKITPGIKVGIGPLKEKGGRSVYAEGLVRSIKHEILGEIPSLDKGDVGGVILSKFTVEGEIRKENEFEIKRTSVLFDLDSLQAKGNLLFLSVDLTNEKNILKESFKKLNLNDRIKIVWFGKLIAMDLVGKIVSDECKEKYKIILMNYNSSTSYSEFFLTMDEKRNLVFSDFAIQLPNNYYVSAEITDIDCISSQQQGRVEFTCGFERLEDIFKEYIKTKKIIFDYSIEYNDEINSMYVNNISNFNIPSLMSILRKFVKNYGVWDFQLNITK